MRKALAGRSKGPPKASCDCEECSNKKCPNAPQMLPLMPRRNPKLKNVSKLSFSKVTKKRKVKKKKVIPTPLEVRRPSILEVMNPDRDCGCEVMVRAIASPLHMNLGMSHMREEINSHLEHMHTNQDEAEDLPSKAPEPGKD